jgi:nucleotidyltransferase/DNA polymerase involved in DNA repair
MSGDGGTLESLHGINQLLLDKLEGVGIQSVSDFATKTVPEILEDYYSNYDEDARGIDEGTITSLVMKAKRKLIEDGLIQKEYSTAEDILEVNDYYLPCYKDIVCVLLILINDAELYCCQMFFISH